MAQCGCAGSARSSEFLRVAVGVDVAYIRASADQITTKDGTIEGYLTDALGIDASAQRDLVVALTA